MSAEGLSNNRISVELGVSTHQVKSALDPDYRKTRKEKARARMRALSTKGLHANKAMSAADRAKAEALLAEVPADTRGLTARLFGDPLPGRSALDRKMEVSQ